MKADLRLDRGRVYCRTPYSDTAVRRFHAIPGSRFHGDTKEWSVPAAPDTISMLADLLGVLPAFLPPDVRNAAGPDGYSAVERVAVDERVLDGYEFITPPYRHQRKNLARLIQNDRWLLADDMGTGKSHAIVNRVAWGLRHSARPHGGMPVLVVCPKSVIPVWLDQFDTHGRLSATHEWEPTVYGYAPHILVTNYERLRRHATDYLGVAWETIVFDELHRLKSFTAQTSRVARLLSARARCVYGLSGTPFPNGLEDALGVLSSIDPNLLPVQTKTAFEARYCVKERVGQSTLWRVTGYRNVRELHGLVSRICSRVTKGECLDLPEKVYQNRVVTLAGTQARVYRDLKSEAVAFLREAKGDARLTVRNVLTESLRLLQVVGGFVPDDDGRGHRLDPVSKAEALREVAEDAGDRPVVVWCAFKAEVDYLAGSVLAPYGRVVTLTGDTPDAERAAAVEAFRSGDARFFVGTQAGGEGINGLQVADLEVFYSRNWNLKDYLQMQDRLHRIGQTNRVTVISLVARGTVDERVAEALERKASLQETLLQDPEKLF